MLLSEHLHEKAEESRHNEAIGYFLASIGTVFFVGGLLETAIAIPDPDWFFMIPYKITPELHDPYSLLGLTLTSIGITLLVTGFALSIHYARERTWYMKQLRHASSTEELEVKKKQIEEKLKKQKRKST